MQNWYPYKELNNNLQMNKEWSGLADLMLCVEHKIKNEAKDHSGKLHFWLSYQKKIISSSNFINFQKKSRN